MLKYKAKTLQRTGCKHRSKEICEVEHDGLCPRSWLSLHFNFLLWFLFFVVYFAYYLCYAYLLSVFLKGSWSRVTQNCNLVELQPSKITFYVSLSTRSIDWLFMLSYAKQPLHAQRQPQYQSSVIATGKHSYICPELFIKYGTTCLCTPTKEPFRSRLKHISVYTAYEWSTSSPHLYTITRRAHLTVAPKIINTENI